MRPLPYSNHGCFATRSVVVPARSAQESSIPWATRCTRPCDRLQKASARRNRSDRPTKYGTAKEAAHRCAGDDVCPAIGHDHVERVFTCVQSVLDQLECRIEAQVATLTTQTKERPNKEERSSMSTVVYPLARMDIVERRPPPVFSSTSIWSPIPHLKEIGREEAFFRRTDHRLPA